MRRLSSTRSTCSGRSAPAASPRRRGARAGRCARGPRPRTRRRHDSTSGASCDRRSSSESAPASIRASSNRSSTSAPSRRAWSWSAHVLVRLGEPVVDRLEHRRDRRDRRAEVVAGRGHELPPGVEEALEARGHLVERAAQLGELARSAVGSARAEVARGDASPTQRGAARCARDRARRARARQRRRRCRRGGDGEDLDVVAHVKHDPAREQHDRERQEDGQQGEPVSWSRTVGRRRSATVAASPTASVARATTSAKLDHGTNL